MARTVPIFKVDESIRGETGLDAITETLQRLRTKASYQRSLVQLVLDQFTVVETEDQKWL